ncbi:MAG: arsenite methyltransferase [Bacteroidales bacterium]|nr:arsenite methyltransferase [Bacteroidales bacterium]
MKNPETLKQIVKEKYAEIAVESNNKACGCCGDKEPETSMLNLDYTRMDGYFEDADLKLGCGIPTNHAGIKVGHSVLDLGSGAGNDVFVARSIVGETGRVTGLDFTDEMLAKASRNNVIMDYENVDFVKGDIEQLPLPDDTYDVVISNCVLNLVPDKKKAFSEIRRVLKSGGHFCISDIVLKGELPETMREAAALYAGCVSGALQKVDYMQIVKDSGFSQVEVKEERIDDVPDEALLPHITKETIDAYRGSGAGIFSITVVGTK